jgi:hypothetical protein
MNPLNLRNQKEVAFEKHEVTLKVTKEKVFTLVEERWKSARSLRSKAAFPIPCRRDGPDRWDVEPGFKKEARLALSDLRCLSDHWAPLAECLTPFRLTKRLVGQARGNGKLV